MHSSQLVWIIQLVFLLTVHGDVDTASRVSRSDDPNHLQTLVMQQAELITDLQAEVASLKSRMAKQERRVAFSVRYGSHEGQLLAGTDPVTLIFDSVDINAGNGYDKVTGIFTAPVSGIYEFSLKVAHDPPGSLHVQILKNGAGIAEVEASGNGPYLDRSSADVITHLNTGDRIWASRVSGDAMHASGDLRSSFMGVLINAD